MDWMDWQDGLSRILSRIVGIGWIGRMDGAGF